MLIIDTDGPWQKALSDNLHATSLSRIQFVVNTAQNLTEAWAQIQSQQPQAIILEVGMDPNALAFIRRVRAWPQTKMAIIVCITHRAGLRDKVAGFQAGADDYLVKPIKMDSYPYRLALLFRSEQRSIPT